MSKPALAVRLDKLLANLGYGSRREVRAMARAERVTLDAKPLSSADERIAVSPDLAVRLRIDGAPLDPLPGLVLMLNKPLGMTCSHKEEGALVYSLLPERWRRREPPISSVGRLDKDTSGLLLLTDDGDLLHRIIAPRSHVSKRYQVGLARPLRGDEAEVFASGTLMLAGDAKPLQPAILEVHAPNRAALTIAEGRYHQVRRMFAATGNHVATLHRDRLGGLDLPDDLAAGAFRILGPTDVARVIATHTGETTGTPVFPRSR